MVTRVVLEYILFTVPVGRKTWKVRFQIDPRILLHFFMDDFHTILLKKKWSSILGLIWKPTFHVFRPTGTVNSMYSGTTQVTAIVQYYSSDRDSTVLLE